MIQRLAGFVLTCTVVIIPREALACPICFGGDPDSQLAQSLNWAVFLLLGVTGGVLSGFVGFIFYLIRRSRQALGQPEGDHVDG
jgi:hypothetical protein